MYENRQSDSLKSTISAMLAALPLLVFAACSTGPLDSAPSHQLLGNGVAALLAERPKAHAVPKDELEQALSGDRSRYVESMPDHLLFSKATYHFKDGVLRDIALDVRPQAYPDVLKGLEDKYGKGESKKSFREWKIPNYRVYVHDYMGPWTVCLSLDEGHPAY